MACNHYALIELIMVKDDIHNRWIWLDDECAYKRRDYGLDDIIKIKKDVFFIGFDLDIHEYLNSEGVPKVSYHTFIPDALKLYL